MLFKTSASTAEPELYLIKMQSRVPKWVRQIGHKRPRPGLRRGFSLRVMATSEKEAMKTALKRKQTTAHTQSHSILSCRKFCA